MDPKIMELDLIIVVLDPKTVASYPKLCHQIPKLCASDPKSMTFYLIGCIFSSNFCSDTLVGQNKIKTFHGTNL